MIILYDGYCPTCNLSVQIASKIDKNDLFRYSPLQSDFSISFIDSNEELKLVDSIIFIKSQKDSEYLIKSDAVIEILKHSKWPIKAFYYLKFIPKGIRDLVYDFIAKNRTSITGKYDTCKIPPSIMGKIIS